MLTQNGAAVELIPAVPALPDLVFTANAALVLDGIALLAAFRHPQRQAEERHVAAAFRALQARRLIAEVIAMPDGLVLEGAGDCVWDATRQLFWMGHGPRSALAASSRFLASRMTTPRAWTRSDSIAAALTP